MLGVEALHSFSEKVKTCQEVKEVSFRKSSLAKSNLESAFVLLQRTR